MVARRSIPPRRLRGSTSRSVRGRCLRLRPSRQSTAGSARSPRAAPSDGAPEVLGLAPSSLGSRVVASSTSGVPAGTPSANRSAGPPPIFVRWSCRTRGRSRPASARGMLATTDRAPSSPGRPTSAPPAGPRPGPPGRSGRSAEAARPSRVPIAAVGEHGGRSRTAASPVARPRHQSFVVGDRHTGAESGKDRLVGGSALVPERAFAHEMVPFPGPQ